MLPRMPIHLRARSALTIVEVLVALMLVSVGLLGVAGTSALSFRTVVAAERDRRAMQRVTTRLARLTAGGCERASSGELRESDLRERWTVASAGNGVALVDASVDWAGQGGRERSFALRSALLC
jgi:Tfp pilus assembly protein PilV